MNNLQAAIVLAQRTATRENKPMAVLNLNPFGALYIVREDDGRPFKDKVMARVAADGEVQK